jgi:hypothetical protein
VHGAFRLSLSRGQSVRLRTTSTPRS